MNEIEQRILVSHFGGGEIIITKIYGYSFDEIGAAMNDISGYMEGKQPLPALAICANYKITSLAFNEAQIGNYPPPNVELPSYFSFDVEFIGFEYEEEASES